MEMKIDIDNMKMDIKKMAHAYVAQEHVYKESVKSGDTAGAKEALDCRFAIANWARNHDGMLNRVFCDLVRSYRTGDNVLTVFEPLHSNKDIRAYLCTLKEYNIEEFTFASMYSDALATAWSYQETGLCRMIGFGKLAKDYDIVSETYIPIPALLFKVL
jgi:hypothetical protein